jgi:hypothetical protein
LEAAREPYNLPWAIFHALESEPNLPDRIAVMAPEEIENPFA